MSKWFFAIDKGGTFTDIIGIDPQNKIHTCKILSHSSSYQDSIVEGIKQILNLDDGEIIPFEKVERIRIGTTIATNALLERKGANTALLITKGFKDLLEIGNQARPSLFDLSIVKPKQLYASVTEVDERLDSRGNTVAKLDKTKLEKDIYNLYKSGYRSLAVVLLHSWKNPIHEDICFDIATKIGFTNISISSQIMPLINIVSRGQTTVVDSYLYPVLSNYISSLKEFLGDIPIEFMQSSGGLVDSESLTGKDSVLSGPAGGVIGSAIVGEANNSSSVIGFDMGGTSTDVSRYGGSYAKSSEIEAGGIKFQTSSLDIETVASGGGSLLWFDGQRLQVGPESAGAIPGPVCYGLDGLLTITDANLILGRINPDFFPKAFGPNRDEKLDIDKTRMVFEDLRILINSKTNSNFTIEELAIGFVNIANEKMSSAIKKVSVSRGYDIRDHSLVCFGGAAPQHCCGIARALEINDIIIHPLSSLLSAYGIANAEQFRYGVKSVVNEYTDTFNSESLSEFKNLEEPLVNELTKLGIEEVYRQYFFDLRVKGTDKFLTIPYAEYRSVIKEFRIKHKELFGFPPSEKLEVVNLRVEVKGQRARIADHNGADTDAPAKSISETEVFFGNKFVKTEIYAGETLPIGTELDGPVIVTDLNSNIVVEPGFRLCVNKQRHLRISQITNQTLEISSERDAISLEIFNNLFMGIAEEMGFTLQNTSHSVNIKERLDFSCALFDENGNLVANAPHVPVHLGAMSESVKSVIISNENQMKKGDCYLINNPHRGGSHLPDLTVISPVFADEDSPIFYVASRGHHADIGGITPGSIPPFSKTIYEEGIIIDNFLLLENGELREKEFEELLTDSKHPARNIEERKHDINAQIAAVLKGIKELENLITKYSLQTVKSYMHYIRKNSAEAMNDALEKYLAGHKTKENSFDDYLDDGSRISVKINITKDETRDLPFCATVDFSGTAPQTKNNLNAPIAVTKAAVLYVFRLLIDKNIPLNSGCLDQIKLIIPEGSILNPSDEAAVVGGNVETSQRITDVLLGALGIAGASQGTMNNFVFGSDDGSGKQYYETIAGGSGATNQNDGASAVQVHMTNTRSTDPEILEHRFEEIRLEKFEIRKGSGGGGKFRGGDGIIREIKFLEPRTVSILSERRVFPPYGMSGGDEGSRGSNYLRKVSGEEIDLGGKVEKVIKSGETVIIKTPGGGGFGSKN